MKKNLLLFSIILFIIAPLTGCLNNFGFIDPPCPAQKGEPVIFIEDGAIDELMVPMLLKTMDGKNGNPLVDLKGIILVEGDSWAFPAFQSQFKLNRLIGLDVPIGISKYEGVNPFPTEYRNDCQLMDALPVLNPPGTPKRWTVYDGDILLKDLLTDSDKPVTILLNCGSTALATVLMKNPELKDKIKCLIWMGGVVNPQLGNVVYPVKPPHTLYYCEWNMYWDPTQETDPQVNPSTVGAGWIFNNTAFPIILFPLDMTDLFPVHYQVGVWPVVPNANAVAFHEKLEAQAEQGYRFSQIALDSYNIPYNEEWNNYYCLWDTVCATYIAHPEFYLKLGYDVRVVQNTNPNDPHYLENPRPQGHLDLAENPNSRVKAVLNMIDGVEFAAVYNYMAEQYKR